jgi:hypothetical protein
VSPYVLLQYNTTPNGTPPLTWFLFKKIREQKFENAPFSFGDEMYGDIINREEAF